MTTIIKTINITQRDIDRGLRHDCNACPAARAIGRVFRGYRLISVSRYDTTVWVYGEDDATATRYESYHPDDLTAFIRAFDSKEPVSPAKFTLEFDADDGDT